MFLRYYFNFYVAFLSSNRCLSCILFVWKEKYLQGKICAEMGGSFVIALFLELGFHNNI